MRETIRGADIPPQTGIDKAPDDQDATGQSATLPAPPKLTPSDELAAFSLERGIDIYAADHTDRPAIANTIIDFARVKVAARNAELTAASKDTMVLVGEFQLRRSLEHYYAAYPIARPGQKPNAFIESRRQEHWKAQIEQLREHPFLMKLGEVAVVNQLLGAARAPELRVARFALMEVLGAYVGRFEQSLNLGADNARLAAWHSRTSRPNNR